MFEYIKTLIYYLITKNDSNINWHELYEKMFDEGVPYPKFASTEQMQKFDEAIKYCVIHRKKFNPQEWGFGMENPYYRI